MYKKRKKSRVFTENPLLLSEAQALAGGGRKERAGQVKKSLKKSLKRGIKSFIIGSLILGFSVFQVIVGDES